MSALLIYERPSSQINRSRVSNADRILDQMYHRNRLNTACNQAFYWHIQTIHGRKLSINENVISLITQRIMQ